MNLFSDIGYITLHLKTKILSFTKLSIFFNVIDFLILSILFNFIDFF